MVFFGCSCLLVSEIRAHGCCTLANDPRRPLGSLVLNAVSYYRPLGSIDTVLLHTAALFRQQIDADKNSVSVLCHTRRLLPLKLRLGIEGPSRMPTESVPHSVSKIMCYDHPGGPNFPLQKD